MSAQLALFEPQAAPQLQLVGIPVPIPHLGFVCEWCEAWPAYHPRLYPSGRWVPLEVLAIVCFEHIYEGRAPEVEYRSQIPRLEWRKTPAGPGEWRQVREFTEGEAADASYRWPRYQLRSSFQ